MGVVYEADHVGLGKRVALKFLLEKYTEDPEVVARFHREARNASHIGHENICDVHDIGEADDGRAYLVMELLEGADLSQVLARSGPMSAERAVHLVNQILCGLAAAHGKGIIHRDMKPENVFVSTRASGDFVKIMDFGISKIIAAQDARVRLTATGAVLGTPVYMAPEQAMGAADMDHRVDIYAVGVMLYELLAGRPPFEAPSYLALVTKHLHEVPPRLDTFRPDLPQQLVAAVHCALEKDPARRFGAAADFARALPSLELLRTAQWDGRVTTPVGSDSAVFATPPRAGAAPYGVVGPAQGAAPVSQVMTSPSARLAVARQSSGWTPLLIVGSAVAIAAALIVFALLTRDGSGSGASASAPASANAPAPGASVAPAASAAEPAGSGAGAPTSSAIEIASQPSEARVFIDGVDRGLTPITLQLPFGTYEIRLEKAGYQTATASKQIRAGFSETFFGALATAGSGATSSVRSGGARRGGGASHGGDGAARGGGSTGVAGGSSSGSAGGSAGGSGSGSAGGSAGGSDPRRGTGSKSSPYGTKSNPYE